MIEFIPVPAPRPTVTYANCTVSAPAGFRPLHLDLHLPPGDGPFPVVLWIHGGGWLEGSRTWMPDTVEPSGFHSRLLARGYAVADVDYRLSGEALYPAQLLDVQSAIRWLRHHATELRLDAGRFATLGESAGGHLAAMAGVAGDGETAIQAVVNWYGATDLLDVGDDENPVTAPALLLGGPIAERRDFAAWASPLHRVHPGTPPFLNVHGTADDVVPFEQSVRLAEALRAQGVRCDLLPVAGAGHCFTGHDDIGALIEAGADFLDDVLKSV
ncbi:alpha/beta hydrolase [Actinoplanes sp. TBRC 11911]|uniref:alpha/beta hydrolase n=1 Tax=Actinoplanes sp. TBRC 11911 TaxID=2729386 RepID=UPI00145D2747|nr:alpha/beta hydrolase [Actinoplanes sp. TBRC 11911]NMO56112.1 alpha/beta hydrolase [Actinoplanes sp. TBRC 11911]